MIEIVLDRDVEEEIKKQIDFLDESKRRSLFLEMQLAITGMIQENIENETEPNGRPWRKSLRAVLTSGKTLRDTSRLFQSIPTGNRIGSDFFTVGSNLSYASDHEQGSPRGHRSRDWESIFRRYDSATRQRIWDRISGGFSGGGDTPQRNFMLNRDQSIPNKYITSILDIVEDFFNR